MRLHLFSPLGWLAFALIGLMLLVGVPLLNSLAPTSPLHLPNYLIPLLGKYVCFARLALSLDLVWGYAGILSLGHGAFFALGGYAMGMHLMREIGTRGVYGDPLLPDFMVFLAWKELPWYWWGFDSFAFALLMVVLVPGALAFVFGWLAFRSRVTGVYFSIITQATTFALMLAFFRNDMGLRRQQRAHRLQGPAGLRPAGARNPDRPLHRERARARPRLPALPLHRAVEVRPLLARDPRHREPSALPRLFGHRRQALRLDRLGFARRDRGRALRAPGRHHQPFGVRAGQFDRARDLGRRRRPRHAGGRAARHLARQLHRQLLHRRRAGILLGQEQRDQDEQAAEHEQLYPEAIALITDHVLEGARDGRSVAELMADGATVVSREQVMEGVAEMIHEVQVEATFPEGTKLVTVHEPIRPGGGA